MRPSIGSGTDGHFAIGDLWHKANYLRKPKVHHALSLYDIRQPAQASLASVGRRYEADDIRPGVGAVED